MRLSIVLTRAAASLALVASTTTVAAIDWDLGLFDKGAAAGRRLWRGTSGALLEGGHVVANAVLDSGGDLVAYQVVRGSRSVLQATVANGMLSVGKKTVVTFKNAGQVVGTVTVDEAGKLSGAVASGIADAAKYAYENGAIVVKDMASLSCNDIARLVGGGGNAKIDVTDASSLKTCGANVAAGFVCAVPAGLETLVTSSLDLASSISEAARADKICRTVLVPPAYEVCGVVSLLAHQIETASKCLLKTAQKLQASHPSFALTEGKCRDIGSFAFNLVLDVASRSSAVKNMPKRIAELLSILMDAADVQEKAVAALQLPDECSEKALTQTALPVVDKVTLYTGKYDGKSLVVTQNLPSLPAGFDGEVTSMRLPAGTTVAVYSDTNYRGVCDSFGTDVKALSLSDIGNNRMSSIRLGEGCPGFPQWAAFKDSKQTGRRVELSKDVPNLASIGFDNVLTSITSTGSLSRRGGCALWSEPQYGGLCQVPSAKENLLPKPMGNDRVSSVRLGRGCPPAAVKVYEDSKFKDTEHVFHGDVPDAGPAGIKNISSLKVLSGNVALYKDPGYGGPCLTVKGDLPLLPAGWNNKVRSLRVRASCAGYDSAAKFNAIVTFGGLCLTALADGSVTTKACDLGKGQKWWSTSAGQIKDDASRCLATKPDKVGTRGTPVFVKACDIDSLAERWAVDDRAPITLVNIEGHAIELSDPWREGSLVRLGWLDGEFNQLFRPSFAQSLRPMPASLPGEALSCSFEFLDKKTYCASGTETLATSITYSYSSESKKEVFPHDAWLVGSTSLPHRAAHTPGDGSFTLSMWFHTTAATKSMVLVDKMTSKNLGYELVAKDGKLVFRIGDGTSVAAVQNTLPADGGFHHVLAVFDRKGGKVVGWLDGKTTGWTAGGAGATTDAITTFKTVEPTLMLSIGVAGPSGLLGTPASTVEFDGGLDELRLYRRALTDVEIAALAKAR